MSVPLEVPSPCCLLKSCGERSKTLSLTDLDLVVCARQWHEHTRGHRDGRDDNRGYGGGNGGNGCWFGWWLSTILSLGPCCRLSIAMDLGRGEPLGGDRGEFGLGGGHFPSAVISCSCDDWGSG